jgi:hypothetical protein
LYQCEGNFLAQQRLAVVSPLSGDQPLYNEDRTVVVVVGMLACFALERSPSPSYPFLTASLLINLKGQRRDLQPQEDPEAVRRKAHLHHRQRLRGHHPAGKHAQN